MGEQDVLIDAEDMEITNYFLINTWYMFFTSYQNGTGVH